MLNYEQLDPVKESILDTTSLPFLASEFTDISYKIKVEPENLFFSGFVGSDKRNRRKKV
jgi:hypothetical protein